MATVPSSIFAWGCLLVGCALVFPKLRRAVTRYILDSSRLSYSAGLSATTLLLSLAYLHFYLRGGPRIIDATSYWLQAHVFAEGGFTFAAPGPVHAFAGRFLVSTPSGDLAVLFPPGFAALLAAGVRVGLPLMVNPLLGALCSLLTYALGRTWWDEKVGRIAGVLSALCATLRYHSADTMSHVFCACLVLGLLLATTARSSRDWRLLALGGLCAGWLLATRPLTGVVFGGAGLLAWRILRSRTCQPNALAEPSQPNPAYDSTVRTLAAYALGCLPGLCLWFAYQWVTTGSAFGSTQAVYYARGDWPKDCFRLGLGVDVGCQFEHGDFLATYQPQGYGWREALAVCGRRLWVHLRDVANLPWLPLVALVTLRRRNWSRPLVVTWGLLTAHVAAYALFYYDGNYPGGGARLYAELLPLQHVLLAAALTSLAADWAAVSLPMVGFALWSADQHAALADREGGRPMHQPLALESAGVARGLVFTNTDHGFNLGFAPGANPHDTPLVVRERGDALDYATWTTWGRPEAYRYVYNPYVANAVPKIVPYAPKPSSVFLGANLWPPLATEFGAATPSFGGSCSDRGLRLHPAGGAPQQTQVQLWVTSPGEYRLAVRSEQAVDVAGWSPTAEGSKRSGDTCLTWSSAARWLGAGPLAVTLVNTGPATLASIELQPL